ncbi:MAG TPA: serine/threonine-protein kinase PknK, partial [Sorangium sp.]|nr:serine/threonine-protein kinase PknK [Sorangium sp.]
HRAMVARGGARCTTEPCWRWADQRRPRGGDHPRQRRPNRQRQKKAASRAGSVVLHARLHNAGEVLQRGMRIDGRFEVEAPIGAGGMGRVYRAKLIGEGGRVALKVLRAHLSGAARQRFEREARILAELHHPSIVGYVGHGQLADGSAYLAMEWLAGETLKARLKRGTLSVADSLIVAERLVHALTAAHQHGVVHRDLKPANVHLVDKDIARIKLLDFGIARQALRGTDLTQPGTPIGTPAYMSPEQVRGAPDIDARSDLYSLGCLLFRCLAGRTPLTASDAVAMLTKVVLEQPPGIDELRPDVPFRLCQIISDLLSKQRHERPPSAASLLPRLAAVERSSGHCEQVLPTVLTRAERRVRCLILVGGDATPDPDVTIVTPPRDRSHMAAVQRHVEQHGGSLHALADGSLVVTMTGASAATDLAVRAARCALRLRPLFPAVSMALATGRAEASVDSLIGDVIERGAAALRYPSHSQVRIDALTAELLSDRFVITRDEHGPLLSGASAPALPRSRGARSCVGRDAELTLLRALLQDTTSEPVAQVALVTGDAGIGKSCLLTAFALRVRRDLPDVCVWWGNADAMNIDTSLYALAQALRDGLGVADDAPLPVQQQRLVAGLGALLPPGEVAGVAAFVGEAIGLPFAADYTPQLAAARSDDSLCREHIQRALLRTLEAAAAGGPLLLVIEDVHWCSASTVQLLDVALRKFADQPLFLLASARPQVHERFRKMWHSRQYQEIRLHGLRRAAARQLLRERLGTALSAEAAARVVDSADGNPFYLEALLREAAKGRLDLFPDSVLT